MPRPSPEEGPPIHHVYLIPGLFGFATIAGYDYFLHLETAILDRFARAGVGLRLERVPSLPTASIAVRAAVLAETVARNTAPGPIHLVGHSSGGLDARLVMSPPSLLPGVPVAPAWRSRVRTVVALSTPHYGTPLAAYFATVSGTRLLYAVSLLTVASLSLGQLPLSAVEALVTAVRAVDANLGLYIGVIDNLTEQVLRVVGERGRREIRDFMGHIERDQAGIIQLMPEVGELFNATVVDAPGVRYGCVATSAPAPRPRRILEAVASPMGALKLAIYTTLYGVATRYNRRYPYATPTPEQARALEAGFRREVRPDNVDGVVPTLSMLWGELLWCGAADHLDVVGHFYDDSPDETHVDWLHSGAHFSRADFAAMVDAVCRFMLE